MNEMTQAKATAQTAFGCRSRPGDFPCDVLMRDISSV